TLRIASGSAPSTSNCRALRANRSASLSAMPSRPNSPSLRAVALQVVTFRTPSSKLNRGGTKTHASCTNACLRVASAVCNSVAPKVPPRTITAAGKFISACIVPPSIRLPPIIAAKASTIPTRLRTSILQHISYGVRRLTEAAFAACPISLTSLSFFNGKRTREALGSGDNRFHQTRGNIIQAENFIAQTCFGHGHGHSIDDTAFFILGPHRGTRFL